MVKKIKQHRRETYEQIILANDLVDAVKVNDKNAVIDMLRNGVGINKRDLSGDTAIHASAGTGNVEMLKFLNNLGGDLNIADENGFTPLHGAIINGKLEAVKYLLDKKADIKLVDNKGYNHLHIAVLSGNLNMVKALIFAGANVLINNKNKNNLTPVDLAILIKENDIVEFFKQQGAKPSLSEEELEKLLLAGKYLEDNETIEVPAGGFAKIIAKYGDRIAGIDKIKR